MSKAQITAHLKKFDKAQRDILSQLRKEILEELPTAKEIIKYGIPTFAIEAVPILGFDGYKAHNSLFPYSGSTNKYLEKELAKYVQTKGSIHFALDKPFPRTLLKKIIKVRITQINASYPNKGGEYLEFYGNGVLKAKGKMKQGKLHGYWEWF
ncbi:MAG: DUF1801 domain-containing protein, partial [Actinobacteria bacterium]|nr:DUF1801 domain-containing protein [Actinomycetota bacterium]